MGGGKGATFTCASTHELADFLLDHYEIIVGVSVSKIITHQLLLQCPRMHSLYNHTAVESPARHSKRTFQVAWRPKCDIPAMNYSRAWDQWSVVRKRGRIFNGFLFGVQGEGLCLIRAALTPPLFAS